nr:uncharacterized protein LOC123753521 [Procambarus clarkii]
MPSKPPLISLKKEPSISLQNTLHFHPFPFTFHPHNSSSTYFTSFLPYTDFPSSASSLSPPYESFCYRRLEGWVLRPGRCSQSHSGFTLHPPSLSGVPAGAARGGKAAKGAGGGYGGNHGLTNFSVREMTWEDIVLAMQLSAMCFGALLALCIVACCAYKICGPAEEIDYSPRYTAIKENHPRLPPELLREIYTLPTSASGHSQQSGRTRKSVTTNTTPSEPTTPAPNRPPESGMMADSVSIFFEGGPRVTSVNRETLGGGRNAILGHLPNGRPRGPPLVDMTPAVTPAPPRRPAEMTPAPPRRHAEMTPAVTPAPPRRPITVQNTRADVYKPPRLLNLNCMLDGRPRLLTLSAMSSSRVAKEVANHGAANRLAEYNQHSSTLDLAKAAAASIPSLSHTHRSLSEPYTSLV